MPDSSPAPRFQPRQVIAPVAFAAGSVLFLATLGIPQQRDVIAVWLLLGLLCFSLSDIRGFALGVVRDWLPFFGVLIAYDAMRGSAKGFASVHYLPQLHVDQALFGGATPTVSLQHTLWHGHPRWYDLIFWGVYLTHFFATPVVAAVLWKIDRGRFRRFAVLVATLSFAGVITYALYPAAPPWMAARDGFLAPVARIIPDVWLSLDLHSAGSVIESGYRYANEVAAVPSLHAAFSLLIAIFLWPRNGARRWMRPLVALYPLAMAFSLVYTGEHYVSDILLGWIYALASVFAARMLLARFAARRRAPLRPPALGAEATP